MIAGISNAPFKSSEPRTAKGTQFYPPCAPAPVGWLRNQGSARSPLSQVLAHGWSAHPGEHTHSSRLFTPPPAPRDVAWAALSLSGTHSHTPVTAGREKWPPCIWQYHPPPLSPCALCSGRNRSKQASASMGETKNLPHGFFLSENGPAVLSRQITSAEANHDPFPPFPRRTPMEATRGLRLE